MGEINTILITGASKGLGKYLVEYYLGKDISVIGCSRNRSNISHDKYKHYCLDITDERLVKNMFRNIRKSIGTVDVLLNNAGVNYAQMPLLIVPLKSAYNTFNVNVFGTFLMAREAIKLMMKNNFGRIVNFGSMAVHHEVRGEAVYTASKAAINSLSRVLAKEVFGYGITCNVIAPSAIKTELIEAIDKIALENILKLNAVPVIGEMTDISRAIDWIISPESSTITGQIIYMGGV
jgi:3-oxoacyl-[acyl-carrier protein] reductase